MLRAKSEELETLRQENQTMNLRYQQKLAHLEDQDRYMRKKLLKLEQDNRFLNDTIYDLNSELELLKKDYGWMFEVYNDLKAENYQKFQREKQHRLAAPETELRGPSEPKNEAISRVWQQG